jgi:protein phosphatase 2C family protein 2/3
MEQNFDVIKDKSGSCAIACLLTDTHVYCANVGDSRAFMSTDKLLEIVELSNDHKPSEDSEQ